MWKEYKRLFLVLWDVVVLFHRNRASFNAFVRYWHAPKPKNKSPHLKVDDKFLTEEFLNTKPYGYEKTLEIAYGDKGTLVKVKDVR